MWWQLVLASVCSNTQALALATIQWAGSPAGRFVLAPGRALVAPFVLPQDLVVLDQLERTPPPMVPHFRTRPDQTITWDAVAGCLEASGRRAGDVVRVNRCNGGAAQQWKVASNGEGRTTIQLKDSKECLVVGRAVDGEDVRNGAAVELKACDNTMAELWDFVPLPSQNPWLQLTYPSSLRRGIILSLSITALLGVLILGASLRFRRAKARAAAVREGSMLVGMEQGGVSLSELWACHRSRSPCVTIADCSMVKRIPAVLALAPGEVCEVSFLDLSNSDALSAVAQLYIENFVGQEQVLYDQSALGKFVPNWFMKAMVPPEMTPKMAADLFKARIKSGSEIFVVTTDDGTVVGFADLSEKEMSYSCSPFPEIAEGLYLSNITVQKQLQRRGIGRMLLNAVEDRAKERGAECIWLFVVKGNSAALALYERAGYVKQDYAGQYKQFAKAVFENKGQLDDVVLHRKAMCSEDPVED